MSTAGPAKHRLDAWRRGGFLPRLHDSLEDLDLLPVLHAEPRRVRHDGVRFQGLRHVAPTLAAYVGEAARSTIVIGAA